MDPGDADREQLESRVDQLEQTVSKMLPDRRGVLKGLGAAAIGGAAVGASSGGASGQSAAGQVGTSSNPVDVEAANVNAGSVNTDQINSIVYGSENISSLPSIADAIDTAEANAPATVAVVDAGTHPVNATENSAALYWNTSGVSLYIGAGVRIQLAAGNDNTSTVLVGDGATTLTDVTVFGEGVIDGNKSSNTAGKPDAGVKFNAGSGSSNLWIEDIRIEDTPGDAAWFSTGSGTLTDSGMRGVTFKDVNEGVNFFDVDGFTIDNLDVYGTTSGDAIEPNNGAVNWEVRDCYIEDVAQQGIDVFDGASDGVVRDVTVVNATDAAFDLSDDATASSNITFINPVAKNCGDGILMKSIHDGIHISDPEIESCGLGVQLSASDLKLLGGEITDCANSGATIGGGAGNVTTIKGVTFEDNNPGGLAQITSSTSADDVYIIENNLIHNGSAPSNAIYIDGANSGRCSLNTGLSGDHTNNVTTTNTGGGFTATPNYF